MVGGAISSAMGGNFWQGFTSAAVAAGVSLAANEVAGEIENSKEGELAGGGAQDTKTVYGSGPQARGASTSQQNPIDSLPPAEESAQRVIDIYHGDDSAAVDRKAAVAKLVPRVAEAAKAKGYTVNDIPIKNQAQFEAEYSSRSNAGHITMVIAHHDRYGTFWWTRSGTATDLAVANTITKNGIADYLVASGVYEPRVFFVSCYGQMPAALTTVLSGGQFWTWGPAGRYWSDFSSRGPIWIYNGIK
jgi:hypothetical protein